MHLVHRWCDVLICSQCKSFSSVCMPILQVVTWYNNRIVLIMFAAKMIYVPQRSAHDLIFFSLAPPAFRVKSTTHPQVANTSSNVALQVWVQCKRERCSCDAMSRCLDFYFHWLQRRAACPAPERLLRAVFHWLRPLSSSTIPPTYQR
jgi:hypothetical protein